MTRDFETEPAGGLRTRSLHSALVVRRGRTSIKTIEAALRLLPRFDFVNAYGLTETSSTI
jgi:hypothetical protein